MMAEYTYQHKENNLGDETVTAPNVQYHSQWIKRWTRETTKSVPHNHQCFAVSSSSKAEVHEKVKRLRVDTLEPRKLKTLKSVMNQGSVSEYKKLYRFGISKVALPVEVQQSVESSYRTSQISHVVQFASEEHQLEAQTNMKCLDQDMQPHIAVKGSSSCVVDIEGSTAQWQIGQCEKQRSSTRPFSTLNLEGRHFPCSSRLEGSEVNLENFSSSNLLLTWKDSVSLKRFDDLGHIHHSSCDLPMLKIHSSSSTMKNTREGQPRLSDAAKAFLMAKNTSVGLSLGKQINIDSSNSTKGKRIAVYEMLTVPKRPDGCSSEGLQKGLRVFELTKDQSRSTSPNEPSTSIYMETDTKLSHPVYKEIHAGSCDPGVLESEACNRWLKRLRSKPIASPAIGSKKFKTGDASGQTCYEIPISPKEKPAVNLKKRMTSSRFPSGISMENFCTWIQRWCCKNTQRNEAIVAATPVSCEAANSHLTKSHEAIKQQQFPSLAAMALVGSVIKQFHTCVFRRVGSSVLWNIEPF